MKQLKRPTLLISHWFPVEMVHNEPKLYKRKRFFLCCKFCSEVSRVSHIKADVLPFLKMWWFFNAIIFKPKLLLLKDKTTNPNMMMMMMTKIRRIYLRSFYRQILCRYFGCMPWWWWWLSTMFFWHICSLSSLYRSSLNRTKNIKQQNTKHIKPHCFPTVTSPPPHHHHYHQHLWNLLILQNGKMSTFEFIHFGIVKKNLKYQME